MSASGETVHDESASVRGASSASAGGASGFEVWARRGCALVVASVAAYASYVHQREFALQGGADVVSATLWPLSVDGLLLLATVGLLNSARGVGRRARAVVWLAFLLGIAVSLAANVAAAPALDWKPVLVAGWPPVALLLSVELLAHCLGGREGVESAGGPSTTAAETRYESGPNPERDESEDTPRDENAADRDGDGSARGERERPRAIRRR
ncbi:DUF2637 domain-containing protein [Streptomyces sp. NPDC058469]|uniref:DUF2637 domain-containing protein n=1 Tax=Streptomyces sp. NPDC058469 TaxID=3346514 RepID=UPI0036626713